MGQAATQDEYAEQDGDALVFGDQVGSPPHERQDGQRNAEIGRGDHDVGDRMQGQDVRTPEQTETVRQEPR